MVFTRDLDPDEHVYANPVSSFLQHVSKASGRLLSKAVKEIRHRVQAHQARKKHQPPSFIQLPPRHFGRRSPSPELRNCNYPPVADTSFSSCQGGINPESTNIYRHREGSQSYESMAQINPLTRLYVTNPDVPGTTRTASDNRSISSSIFTTRAKTHIIPPPSLKRPLRPIRPSRSKRTLEIISEESISTDLDSVDLPPSVESVSPQKVHSIDELLFTASSADTQGRSHTMRFSPYSNQDPVFRSSDSPSSSQVACLQPQKDEVAPKYSHMSNDPPIRVLRSSRGRRLSVAPRIPSLYFRAGSPFADRNLPWDRLNNPESNGQSILSQGRHD